MMKNALTALVIVLGSATAAFGEEPATRAQALVASPDPDRLAVAREVVDLAFPPAGRLALLSRVGESMMAQARNAALPAGTGLDAGARAILDRFDDRIRALANRANAEHSDALFGAFARAYAREFTRDELIQIRTFVATPAGAHYLQRSTDLLSDPDVAAANTAYMRSVFLAIRPLQGELRTELMAYFSHRRR